MENYTEMDGVYSKYTPIYPISCSPGTDGNDWDWISTAYYNFRATFALLMCALHHFQALHLHHVA